MTPQAVPRRPRGGGRRATPGRSSSSRSPGEPLGDRTRAVHDALRVRGRRGADLGQRPPERRGPVVHTVRAVGAVTRAICAAQPGARARRARAVRQRLAARRGRRRRRRRRRRRDRAGAAAPVVLRALAQPRRLRRGRRALRRPHARRPALRARARALARARLEVEVTVDARRRRLARQGRRRAEAGRASARFDPARRPPSSAGPRS